jgi:hypothetical protein
MNTNINGRLVGTLAALLISLPLAACATTPTGSGGAPSPQPASTPSDAAKIGSAPAEPTSSRVIPAGALLQPADLNDAMLRTVEQGDFGHLRPLRPCNGGAGRYPSDGGREAAVAVTTEYQENKELTATVVMEYLALHKPGSAADVIDDVRQALRRCPGGLGKDEYRWKIIGSGIAGDESILVRMEDTMTLPDGKKDVRQTYAALARVGDAVLVVADLGWEFAGGDERKVRALTKKAVERARVIR